MLRFNTRRGNVDIAIAPDGRYHIVWHGDSLGSADSLRGVLIRATAGPLKRGRDGTDVMSLGLSRDTSKWIAVDTGPVP